MWPTLCPRARPSSDKGGDDGAGHRPRFRLRSPPKKNAAARGAQLWDGINALKAKYPVIGDVRGGHGLMLAIELAGPDKAAPPKVQPGQVQAAP